MQDVVREHRLREKPQQRTAAVEVALRQPQHRNDRRPHEHRAHRGHERGETLVSPHRIPVQPRHRQHHQQPERHDDRRAETPLHPTPESRTLGCKPANQHDAEQLRMVGPVVVERVRRGEMRRQRPLVGQERQGRHQQQSPAQGTTPEPAEQRLGHPVEPPQHRQQRHDNQRVGKDVDHVPQVVPGRRQDRELHVKVEILAVERPEIRPRLALGEQLEIGLRCAHHQHAEDNRHEQPHEAPRYELAQPALVDGEAQRDARDQEQQRQAPRVDQRHHQFQPRPGMRAFHVPAPRHVEHADVVEDQETEGDDAQPVEIVAALRTDGGKGLC